MPDLSPFLTITVHGDQVPPPVIRAVQAGWVGGILLAPTSLWALGEVSWLLHDTARRGRHQVPQLYLEPSADLHSLFPLPSLGAMTLSGMSGLVRQLVTTVGEQIRQFRIHAVLGPDLDTGSDLAGGNPWSEQTSRFTQIWVNSWLDSHIVPFLRVHDIPSASSAMAPAVLCAAIDAGLPGIIFDGPQAPAARTWTQSLQYSGLTMRDLRRSGLLASDLTSALADGFHTVLLPEDFPVDRAFAALHTAWAAGMIPPALLRAVRELAHCCPGQAPAPAPGSVPQDLTRQWSEDIWAEAVIHTGPPFSVSPTAKIVLIEFGSPSALALLLGTRLARHYVLPVNPTPQDLPEALTRRTGDVRVVCLNHTRLHPGQMSALRLCHPSPIALAMDHPEDLLTLPAGITGLTNFDRQAGAYQAIAAALLGKVPVPRKWPAMSGQSPP